MFSDDEIDVIDCDMKVAGVGGHICHAFDKWYSVEKDNKNTHMFYFDGISKKKRTTFYKITDVSNSYYLLQADGEICRWINLEKKKSGYLRNIGSEIVEHLPKIVQFFEKYNLNIEKHLSSYSGAYNYREATKEIYIWIKLHYNYIFAHIYPDARETYSVRVSKKSEMGPYLNRIASLNVENTEHIFGCCELTERYTKSKGVKFPFRYDDLRKISLDKHIYTFRCWDDKDFQLYISGDALVSSQNEFSEFPSSEEIANEVFDEIQIYIKDEIDKKNRRISISSKMHYQSKRVIALLDALCADRGYTGEYWSPGTMHYIITTP